MKGEEEIALSVGEGNAVEGALVRGTHALSGDEDEFSYSGYSAESETGKKRRGISAAYGDEEEYSYSGYTEDTAARLVEAKDPPEAAREQEGEFAFAEAVSYGDFLIEEYSVESSVKKVENLTHLPENTVKYILAAIYFIVGVLCVSLTNYMLVALPYIVGALMVLMGVFQLVSAIRTKEYVQTSSNKTAGSLIIIALAVMILIENEWASTFIPIVWGVIGLVEGAHAFNHAISRISRGMRCSYYLVKGIIEVVLAFLLLYQPEHHITLHIIVFGVQLMFDGITMLPFLKKRLSKG